MRVPCVAGNWKMNLNLIQAIELASAIDAGSKAANGIEIVVCPAFVHVQSVAKQVSSIMVGGQNLYDPPKGAYTGEVSGPMLRDVGAKFVILGHSERRHTIGHHEDDAMINRKVRAALTAGLTPILCVGETLAERDAGQTLEVLTFQLTAGLIGLTLSDAGDKAPIRSAAHLIVAYEPVWAIGTGRNATPEQAQEAHAHLRKVLRSLTGGLSEQIRILYGGSMTPENAASLLKQPDVDGGLVGGASLKPESFLAIIRAAKEAKAA